MNAGPTRRALVVDDEPANRDFLSRLLEQAALVVTSADCGKTAIAAAKAAPGLSIAVIDWELPDMKGLDLLGALRTEYPEMILVIATMHDDRAIIAQAFSAGCDAFLVKPHGFMELFRRLRDADDNPALLRQIIIDQYGPRPYRGPSRPGGPRPPAAQSA